MTTAHRSRFPSRRPVRRSGPVSRAALPRRAAAATLALAAGMTAMAPRLSAQNPALPSATGDTVVAIRNVRVFDGVQVRDGQTVVLAAGRIRAVGADVAVPSGAAVVDGAGRTLLPGLIDAHVHTFARGMLEAAARFGVTTELDQFTAVPFAADMRQEQAAGDVHDRADLFSAGTLATAAGGHGTQYGMAIPTVAGPDDAAPFVTARKAEGSDWLKIVWEDGSTYGGSTPTHDAPTVRALIRAADDAALPTVIHVSTVDHARQAAGFGVDGLVHAPHDRAPDPDLAEVLVANGTFMVPTLTVTRSVATGEEGDRQLADPRLAARADPQLVATLRQSFPLNPMVAPIYGYAAAATRQLLEAGGVVLAGTDAPNPGTAHGLSMHRELELLVDAGLSPLQALAAATSAPADAFGLDDRGRIAVGRRADLLLVEGDPTSDITATRAIVAVWRNGAVVPAAPPAPVARGDAAAASVAAAAPVPGPVSDFDDGTARTAFGSGWIVSTDRLNGGESVATMAVEDGALQVRGEVRGTGFNIRSGTMFSPGPGPMQPADLSTGTGLRFRVRGDVPSLTVMLFSQSAGQMPAFRQIPVTPEWTSIEIPFGLFGGADPETLAGVWIGVSGRATSFAFALDDVAIY